MLHQSVRPLALIKLDKLSPPQTLSMMDGLRSVQPGRQGSAGKRRSSSSGDAGWPKAAWYLKGMGRYAAGMHIACLLGCTDMKFGTVCDL